MLAAPHSAAQAKTFAFPNAAQSTSFGSPCIAYGDRTTQLAEVLADVSRWNCDIGNASIAKERAFVRFDIPGNGAAPRYFSSRISAMKGIAATVIGANGAAESKQFSKAEMGVTYGEDGFYVELPRLANDARPTEVVAIIDQASSRSTLSRSTLKAVDPGTHYNLGHLLGLAAICGVLVIPLIFSVLFYRVLRENFVLWHAAMAGSLLGYVLVTTGLISFIVTLNTDQTAFWVAISFSASVGCGIMFMLSYAEPGMISRRLRRLLYVSTAAALASGLVRAFAPFFARTVQPDIYYIAHMVMILLTIAAIAQGFKRGSRSMKFLAAGWSVILVVGSIRVGSYLFQGIIPADAASPLHIGLALEVLVTSIGVMDRFMVVKRQRDQARAQAAMMEQLADRDPLTGLMNRRAIVPQYDKLRVEGFVACALIDLDRFKAINDEFGHAIGDDVLCAAARALAPDENTLVVRMGGEEFMLFLRGNDARDRAEQRRRAISQVVANQVEGLDRIVTASMGLVILPRPAADVVDFGTIYQRADKLLYKAKDAGRNRTVSETMTVLPEPTNTARKTPRVA